MGDKKQPPCLQRGSRSQALSLSGQLLHGVMWGMLSNERSLSRHENPTAEKETANILPVKPRFRKERRCPGNLRTFFRVPRSFPYEPSLIITYSVASYCLWGLRGEGWGRPAIAKRSKGPHRALSRIQTTRSQRPRNFTVRKSHSCEASPPTISTHKRVFD